MNFRLLSLFLLISTILSAQNTLPIGAWRTHLPQRVGNWITQSEDQIIYATTASLMFIDKDDEIAPKYVTKVDGLSGVDIRLLKYHQPSEQLLVVYEDGIIDLYRNGEVFTVNSIKNFTNITGVKTVNDVFVYDAETVFLAGTYGVSVFNVANRSFPFTTFMGEANVLSVAVYEGNIYAGTEEGIYTTTITNPNADDFGTWALLDAESGFPGDYATRAMCVYNGQLYFGIDEDIYRLENNAPVLFSDESDAYELRYLSAEGAHILAGFRCIGENCGNGQIRYFKDDGTEGNLNNSCIGRVNYGIEDQQGRVWLGDEWRGYRWLDDVRDGFCNTFENENSPYSERVWDLKVYEDELWLAAGSYSATFTPQFVDHGMASFKEGQWSVYNRWTTEAFRGDNPDPNERDDDVFALIETVVNPVNGKVYGASYFEGLIEIDGENVTLYNDQDTPLSNTAGDASRTRVSGMAVDEEGGLWLTNFRAIEGSSLHRLAPDGTWVSFPETCGETDLFDIVIDRNGYKWIISSNNNVGLLLYDEGDLNNLNDDRCRLFTANNSNLPTNRTNCMVMDLDGDVWVGTEQGIVIFECGGAPFDDNCIGSLRTVDLDGFLEYLFKTQSVQAIAVDGANRKWVGTTNGAYLISADGKEELMHFTAENSPLLDDFVRDIAVNQRTGEVFIGTDRGLISYQGDAVEGRRFHGVTPEVFPNPVRPDYDGPITVRGLTTNANVKITDVNGQLVYETNALGGQLVWDGRDYNGRKVQTGVYLVFSSTNPREAGLAQPDAAVAKILFIN